MLNFKKYALLMILLQFGSVDAMNLGHIINCHVYNDNKKYTDIVKNSETGVISAISMDNRKTIFPENMTKESLEKELLYTWSNGEILAATDTLKYIRHPYSKLVIGIAKNASDNIVTAYPVLKYIPLSAINDVDKDVSIYIATVHNKKNKTAKRVSSTVGEIKERRYSCTPLAVRWTSDDEGVAVVDISAYYTDAIYSGIKNERGSILVEVECIASN